MKLDYKEINGHYMKSMVLIANVPFLVTPPFPVYACNFRLPSGAGVYCCHGDLQCQEMLILVLQRYTNAPFRAIY